MTFAGPASKRHAKKSDLIVEIQNLKAASDELESKIGPFEKERNSVEEFKKDCESIEKEIKDRDSELGQLLKDKSDLTASLEAAMSDLEANRNQLKLVQDEFKYRQRIIILDG